MNTWISGKDLMKNHYQIIKFLTVNRIYKTLLIKTTHAQKVFEEFNLKNVGYYHDLYVQSDALLLAHVFENFRNKCIEIYETDPAHFLSAPGLAW